MTRRGDKQTMKAQWFKSSVVDGRLVGLTLEQHLQRLLTDEELKNAV